MDSFQEFQEDIDRAIALFKTFDSSKPIRVISHLDADGISAASLVIKMLTLENRKHVLSIVTQLKQEKLEELSAEDYDYYFFTDLGSGHINIIQKLFKDKKVIILDHHEIEEKVDLTSSNISLINPHKVGIDGSKTVSGSGVVFFFAKTLNSEMEKFAHIAIIGAMGDMQEDKGFQGLNEQILECAVKHNKVNVKKSLRSFGLQSRPLYKALEYSSDPYLPGITNSESGSIQFLQGLNISPQDENGEWRKMSQLSHEELQNLIAGIILRRSNEKDPSDIIGNIYLVTDEPSDSPIKDVREFATLLNSCGRMDRASLGIGVCLGDQDIKNKALNNLNDYRKEIVKGLNWYDSNKKTKNIVISDKYILINAEDNVLHTIIGTVASILSNSNDLANETYIVSMARNKKENLTKVSIRVSGRPSENVDVHALLARIIEKTGGETGGHAHAAGGVIETANEQNFMKEAQLVLEKL